MGLTLTTLRCPDSVAPETRHVAGGEFSIGRGAENDWALPDPERHISKRHCVLAFRSGQWQLADVSANGTYLNREAAPLGAGAPRTVRSGDRIRCGTYEIELTIAAGEERAPPRQAYTPETLDPFAEEEPPARHDAMLRDPGPANSVLLPDDFDPLAPEEDPFRGPTHADHAPAVNDAFRPPPRPASVLPDDWELDSPAPPAAMRPAPAPAPPPPAPTVAVPSPAEPPGLLAAFLRGTGLPDAVPADPARALEAAGATLRAAVAGIRATLIARASIKGEFRIEQTMVRASGNNPLKFSADDDDAMAALLGAGRRGSMAPEQAMAEAMADMRLHELATVTAMQSAVRALLAQFDPAAIERGVEAMALDRLPGQRKSRAWDSFAAQHTKVSQALADDFDSVFGRAFARAYEQALRDATNRENRS